MGGKTSFPGKTGDGFAGYGVAGRRFLGIKQTLVKLHKTTFSVLCNFFYFCLGNIGNMCIYISEGRMYGDRYAPWT